LRGRGLDLAGRIVEFVERRDEPERISRQLSTAAVSRVFAGPADCRLHQNGSQRCAAWVRVDASELRLPPNSRYDDSAQAIGAEAGSRATS